MRDGDVEPMGCITRKKVAQGRSFTFRPHVLLLVIFATIDEWVFDCNSKVFLIAWVAVTPSCANSGSI